MQNHAIFLDGPIGAGKSALGRALAERLGGGFVEGDDHAVRGKPWFCSSLRTSRAIVTTVKAALRTGSTVVIAYPLRCINWIYFRRTLTENEVVPIFVSLRADYDAILAPHRGRVFSDAEKARIQVMIAEGYGARTFSDFIFRTDQDSFENMLEGLTSKLHAFMRP